MKITNPFNRKQNSPPYPVNGLTTERKPTNAPRIVWLLMVITVASLALAGYSYYKYQQLKNTSPSVASQTEAKELVAKASRLMMLPQGEIPTVATISDVTKLKDQPFFANATNGDKLLIYSQAKLAVLYSPKTDKIVNVGPLNIDKPITIKP